MAAGYVLHLCESHQDGCSKSEIKVGDKAMSKVDYEQRNKIIPNHTFTHALNFALRKVLGSTIDQKVIHTNY